MIQIDMPMPESCGECPLKYEATEGGSEYCCLLDKRVGETYRYRTHRETWMKDGLDEKRLPDCPLREADIVFDKSKVFAFAMDDMTDEEYFDFLKNNSIMMRKGATDEPATED